MAQRNYILHIMCLCVLAFVLVGCKTNEEQSNVVATVNGKPIFLHTVQLVQEVGVAQFDMSRPPTLGRIRNQYGSVLAELVVYEVMLQYLEKNGLAVTTWQLAEYEKSFRENFSDEEFRTLFLENAIDVSAWRDLLRYHLGVKRFMEMVLLRDYVPTLSSVENVYNAYPHNFHLPARLALSLATAPTREALKPIKTAQDLEAANTQDTTINFYKAELRHDIIESEWPKAWQKRFFALKENMCTDTIAEDGVFKKACLEYKIPEKQFSRAEAYPYIENLLKEEHTWPLLEAWLMEELKSTNIRVSVHLLKSFS